MYWFSFGKLADFFFTGGCILCKPIPSPPIEYDSSNIFYPNKSSKFHPMISGGAGKGDRYGLDMASRGVYPGIPIKRRPIANFNPHRPST